ncbi:MAG: hypothetical protein JNM03_03655 [Sphingopyxis sp.]|uniref:hypothetical protein n=1 Tax=Sphingopyxis sp. TaxID=1908224 RepID=UPI001A4A91DC|nr:hypothetical protein [Sphingopyxis sp.]MBL9069064.1 hypothetical protein [Sphingopyxis sp.]
MTKLRNLVAEVDAALDIYLAGRTGRQFNKVAFILADDCCELASKLYLIMQNPGWSDAQGNGRFKSFRTVTSEVRAALPATATILARIEARRVRRNGFFHSADLLDLTLQSHDVNDAMRDMLDYGALLFGQDWADEVTGTGNMETAEVILRLDCAARADPRIGPKVSDVFAKRKRTEKQKAKGCEVTHHPEDHHLRLAIRNGGKELRDQLAALLPP